MPMDILHTLIVMDQSRILLTVSLLFLEGIDILLESSAVSKHGILNGSINLYILCNVMLVVLCYHHFLSQFIIVFHKPCPLQISLHQYTSTYVYFSWTGCSRDKVAPALEYLVSCADYIQIQGPRSTSKAMYGLRPNKWYSCSVYGIDSLGRLGEDASFRFRTNQIGKL